MEVRGRPDPEVTQSSSSSIWRLKSIRSTLSSSLPLDTITEWNNKAAAYGARAAESLRLVMGELLIAALRAHAMLSLFTDFENCSVFMPSQRQEQSLNTVIDRVIAWGTAIKSLRTQS